MDINKAITELKQRPGFADNVGMMLIHNGIVRSWSRKDRQSVASITLGANKQKIDAICRELEQRPGIFAIVNETVEGECKPGDDALLLIVAGDIREHVKGTFSELLERVKSEGLTKQEHFAD